MALNLRSWSTQVLKQDNEAVIKIVRNKYSIKLRHCGRVHRVNIASVAEVINDESHLVKLEYCNTQVQLSDQDLTASSLVTGFGANVCSHFRRDVGNSFRFEIAFATLLQCLKLKLGHMMGLRGGLLNTTYSV